MHHDVFNLRKILFDIIMYGFGYFVCLLQCVGSICTNLHIHIYLVAEYTCLKQINSKYILVSHDTVPYFSFSLVITGVVYHFIYGIFKNIVCCFYNKDEYYKAGNRIHYREAKSCTCDSDKCSD